MTSGRTKKIISLMMAFILSFTSLGIPVMGEETEKKERDASLISETNSGTVSDDSVSGNFSCMWDRLNVSGKQASFFKGNDGKYYGIKGTKVFVGTGASSGDRKVLKIDKKGFAKVGKAGTTSLVSRYGDIEVTVIDPKLSEKKKSIVIGEKYEFMVSGLPEGVPVAWESENQNAVQVYNGTVYGTGVGKSNVFAYIGGKAFKTSVKVKDVQGTVIVNVPLGKGASIKGIKGIKKQSFSSSDNKVRVEKGMVTSGSKTPVSLNAPDGHELIVYLNDPSLKNGSYNLKTGERMVVLPENSHELLSWKSKNPGIAVISEYGVLIGQGPGNTILTAKTGGRKISVRVSVSDEEYEGGYTPEKEEVPEKLMVVDPVNGNDGENIFVYSKGYVENKTQREKREESERKPDPMEGKFIITFDTGGGENIESQIVEAGEKAYRPSVPGKTNSVFGGWDREGFVYDFDAPVTENMTLRASWLEDNDGDGIADSYLGKNKRVFIAFDLNGGSLKSSPGSKIAVKYFKNGIVDISDIIPEKEGDVFLGWEYSDKTEYSSGDEIKVDTILSAKWENEEYSKENFVLFDDGFGYIYTVTADEEGHVIPPGMEKEGYRFSSWEYSDGTEFSKNDIIMAPAVVYAVWEPLGTRSSVVVRFLPNNGEDVKKQIVRHGGTAILPDEPVYPGYSFDAWYLGDEKYDFSSPVNTAITLNGRWKENEYTLYYNGNGAKGTKTGTTVNYSTPIAVNKDGFRYPGYKFLGYSLDPDAVKADYPDGSTMSGLTDKDEHIVMLYAIWKSKGNGKNGEESKDPDNTDPDNPEEDGDDEEGDDWESEDPNKEASGTYIITFDGNGGSGVMEQQEIRVKEKTSLTPNTFSPPVKAGETYVFNYWNTKKNGSGKNYSDGAEVKFVNNGSLTLYAQWMKSMNTHLIKFDYGIGYGTVLEKRVAYNDVYGELPVPEVENEKGHSVVFKGWYTAPDKGSKVSTGTKMKDSDITLYARYEDTPSQYSIAFYSNGGTGTMSPQTFKWDEEQPLKNVGFKPPVETGTTYSFACWNTEPDGSGLSYNNKENILNLTTDGIVRLYAQWAKADNIYSVAFNSNGGSGKMPEKTFIYGKEQTLPEMSFTYPETTGYTYEFLGWNTKKDGSGDLYGDKDKVKNLTEKTKITLYAQWKKTLNSYSVSFDPNGGSGEMEGFTLNYNESRRLPEMGYGLPAYRGYTVEFKNWNTKKDGTGKSYNDGVTIKNLTNIDKEEITLYAQWKLTGNKYEVIFDSNGGSGTMSTQSFVYGTKKNLTGNSFLGMNAPVGYSYVFNSWNTKKDGSGTSYGDKEGVTGVTDKGTITLYAQWEKKANTYTVQFSANGGSGKMNNQSFEYDTAGNLDTNAFLAPAPVGYVCTFNSWNTRADGSGTAYKDKASVKNLASSGNVVLYAIWNRNANKYTVVFNANGGSGAMDNQTFTYGVSQKLTANKFSAPSASMGYTNKFDSWNTKADGTGKTYKNETSVSNLTGSGTVTLYARWKPEANVYTVKFNPNTGTGSMTDQNYKYDMEYVLPENGFKSAPGYTYTFQSWNTKKDGSGTKYTDKAKIKGIIPSGSITLYAQWKKTPYKYYVAFNPKGSNGTGSGTMGNQTFTYGVSQKLTANAFKVPTAAGYTYTFKNWNLKTDGTGKAYSNEASVENLTTTNGGTVTLYAQWNKNANKYKVTLHPNTKQSSWGTDDKGNVIKKTKEVTYNSTYGDFESVTRTGYDLGGWYTAATEGTKIEKTTRVTITAAQTLYAHWSPHKYTIQYNYNCPSDGTNNGGTTSAQTKTYGTALKLQKNGFKVPTKTGYTYTFDSWNTKADGKGTKYTAESNLTTDLATSNGAKVTLYAQWKRSTNTYTVAFNANKGTGSMGSQSFNYNEAKTLTPNAFTAPTETGYTYSFNSWNTKADGTGTKYTDKQSVKNLTSVNGGKVTLYAIWNKKGNTYKITLNPGNGQAASSVNVTYGGTYKPVTDVTPSPKYSYQYFIGWNTKSDGKGTYIKATDVVKTAQNQALWGQWGNRKYTIRWTEPLAKVGGFEDIPNTTFYKSIEYTDKDGVTKHISPYQSSGSIEIRPGTKICMGLKCAEINNSGIVGNFWQSDISWYVGDNKNVGHKGGAHGERIWADYTPAGNGLLTFVQDEIAPDSGEGHGGYGNWWHIRFTSES